MPKRRVINNGSSAGNTSGSHGTDGSSTENPTTARRETTTAATPTTLITIERTPSGKQTCLKPDCVETAASK